MLEHTIISLSDSNLKGLHSVAMQIHRAYQKKGLKSDIVISFPSRSEKNHGKIVGYLGILQNLNAFKSSRPLGGYHPHRKNTVYEMTLNPERFYECWSMLNSKFQGQPMHKDESSPDSAKPFKGLSWIEITIKFLNGHDVKIYSKHVTGSSDYKRMGFDDTRKNKPNSQWKLLLELAGNNGEISWNKGSQHAIKGQARRDEENLGIGFQDDLESPKTVNKGYRFFKISDAKKKAKQLLAKQLKSYFGINQDPFYPYHESKAYKIKLALIPE